MTQLHQEDSGFKYGDPIVLFDLRRRPNHCVLKEGGISDFRGDRVEHADVIGQVSGCRVFSLRKNPFWAFKPTMPEYALSMTRSATIIYPKDVAYLLMHADIGTGMKVVEGGFGSGSMTMGILRAISPTGELSTYELREDAATRATRNVEAFLGPVDNHRCLIGDVYEGIEATEVDRIILDVPEPWRVLDHGAKALVDGGILAAYLPTILQVHQHVLAARAHPDFFVTEAVEILERKWHVTEESVRPAHQMTGHTGFLCFSRRIGRPTDDESKRRK